MIPTQPRLFWLTVAVIVTVSLTACFTPDIIGNRL